MLWTAACILSEGLAACGIFRDEVNPVGNSAPLQGSSSGGTDISKARLFSSDVRRVEIKDRIVLPAKFSVLSSMLLCRPAKHT